MSWALPKIVAVLVCIISIVNGASQTSEYIYDDEKSSSLIVEYKPENQGSNFLTSRAPRVVVFYRPQCGGCITFKKSYLELAKKTKALYPSVEFHAVSCDPNNVLCLSYKEVDAYPTVLAFGQGKKRGVPLKKSGLALRYSPSDIAKTLYLGDPKSNPLEGSNMRVHVARKELEIHEEGDHRLDMGEMVANFAEHKKKRLQEKMKRMNVVEASAFDIANKASALNVIKAQEATQTMKVNTPGTDEFQKERNKGKPFEKTVKLASKRRVFRRKKSPEQVLYVDASLAMVNGLLEGLFLGMDGRADAKRKSIFIDWLDLLSMTLPPDWAIHALVDDLRLNVDFVSEGIKNFISTIEKHHAPKATWSKGCGLTCGTWKLFHVISIGLAEHRGGLNLVEAGAVPAGTRTFSPKQAANVFREYMAQIYFCADCRKHFLMDYDQCMYNSCSLKDDDELETPEDWKEFALWLWRVHNGVSLRLAKERGLSYAPISVIQSVWPHLEMCLQCFNDDGTWNEGEVFEQLEMSYW
eukprot:scaffold74702_cov53-Attheya_sp.AAC.2